MPNYYDVSSRTSNLVNGQRKLKRRGIVIHTTEGYNSLAWLQGESAVSGNPASADFLITRSGDIYQITPPGLFAYHSGRSRHLLYQEPDKTISQGYYGIELEQYERAGQKVTDNQYISVAWLSRILIAVHRMDFRCIVGHYEIALPAGRKSDPTGFDWTAYTLELLHPSPDWNHHTFRSELP